jgi:hypothetical protein
MEKEYKYRGHKFNVEVFNREAGIYTVIIQGITDDFYIEENISTARLKMYLKMDVDIIIKEYIDGPKEVDSMLSDLGFR